MNQVYVFRRLFQYVSRYKSRLYLIAFLGLMGVLFEVAKPLPVKFVIDFVLSNQPLSLPDWMGLSSPVDKNSLLFACVGAMLLIAIANFFLTITIFNLTVRMAQRLVFDLMIDFFAKLQRLSLNFYAKNQVGDLLQRMSGDVFVVYFLVAQIVLPALTSIVCLGAMFYIMSTIDVLLAIVAFSVVPLLVVLFAFFAKPLNDSSTVQYQKQGQFSAFLQQSLSSMKIIQAFGRESFMHQKLKKHAEEFSHSFIVANRISMTFNQFSVLITAITSALLVLLGSFRGLNGELSVGDLFIFLGYLTALSGPVNLLANAVGTAVAIGARGKRVFDILDSDDMVKEKSNAKEIANVKGEVEFRNVSFSYGNALRKPVLNNISFRVLPGQVVAIVGATGAGKSSIISLLARFYDPSKGSVLLDGVDIADLKIYSLREQISLVLQEPFIFPMSIAENISFGNPDASFEEIVEAAKGAQAHEFILKLPNGYETVVSESGTTLSGGEKQRIGIARAFLKKAPILILDEPTSAVDAATEAKIFDALGRFSKGKTVFLVTHRLSTIKHADQIITIQAGTVAELGTHASLMEKGALYADLYKYHHIN